MTDTLTPSKSLIQPTVGGDDDTWGTVLNTTISLIDMALGGTLTLALSGNTTLTGTQARNTGFIFTGSLGSGITVTWPSYYGLAAVQNSTNQNITISISGATLVVAPDSTIGAWSDGSNFYSITGADTAITSEEIIAALGYVPAAINSPHLTGTPTAPTPASGDNSIDIATTAFVAINFAPLSSPHLTGTPTAPTASGSANSTQIATTAFVQGLHTGLLNTLPIGTNTFTTGTSITLTSATFTAPSNGFALARGIVKASPSVGLNLFTFVASLSGLVDISNNQNGIIDTDWAYLPMTTGQTSTFTVHGTTGSSVGLSAAVMAFFVPLP